MPTGNYQTVTTPNSIVHGNHCTITAPNCTVFGNHNRGTGPNITMHGNHNVATGPNATLYGNHCTATGSNSKVVGAYGTATGPNSKVVGGNSSGSSGGASVTSIGGCSSISGGEFSSDISFAADGRAIATITRCGRPYARYEGRGTLNIDRGRIIVDGADITDACRVDAPARDGDVGPGCKPDEDASPATRPALSADHHFTEAMNDDDDDDDDDEDDAAPSRSWLMRFCKSIVDPVSPMRAPVEFVDDRRIYHMGDPITTAGLSEAVEMGMAMKAAAAAMTPTRPAVPARHRCVEAKDGERECAVCQVNRVDARLDPCGHTSLCVDCAGKIYNDAASRRCPICNKNIERVDVVFL